MKKEKYSNIDMIRTGSKIKGYVQAAGYTVKDIQNYLQLECPQPIYRWFKGRILPSLEHLFMLSRLLGVHMDDMLVAKEEIVEVDICDKQLKRLHSYYMWMVNKCKMTTSGL